MDCRSLPLPRSIYRNPGLVKQRQALAAYDAHFKGCIALHDTGKFKTYKQVAQCADNGFVDLMTAAGYRYIDLLNVIVAEHAVIAERLDAKKITWPEAQLKNAELISRIAAECNAAILKPRRQTRMRPPLKQRPTPLRWRQVPRKNKLGPMQPHNPKPRLKLRQPRAPNCSARFYRD